MRPHDTVSSNVEHVVDCNVPEECGTEVGGVCVEGVWDGIRQGLCR